MINAVTRGMFLETMKTKMDDFKDTKRNLMTRIEEAEYGLNLSNFSLDQIRDYLKSFQNIRTMSSDEQKKAIAVFVDRVTVFEDHIQIEILNPLVKQQNGDFEATEDSSSETAVLDMTGGGDGN